MLQTILLGSALARPVQALEHWASAGGEAAALYGYGGVAVTACGRAGAGLSWVVDVRAEGCGGLGWWDGWTDGVLGSAAAGWPIPLQLSTQRLIVTPHALAGWGIWQIERFGTEGLGFATKSQILGYTGFGLGVRTTGRVRVEHSGAFWVVPEGRSVYLGLDVATRLWLPSGYTVGVRRCPVFGGFTIGRMWG